jgi:hypothetical protein
MIKTKFKMNIISVGLIILKFFIIYSNDVTADVDHLHDKKI